MLIDINLILKIVNIVMMPENIKKIQIGLPICILIMNIYEPMFSSLAFAFGFYILMDHFKSYFIFRDYIHNEL